jgi:hypothetical protein
VVEIEDDEGQRLAKLTPESLLSRHSGAAGVNARAQPSDVRPYLRGTIMTAALLSSVFDGWGLLLFSEAEHFQCVHLALRVRRSH